MAPKFMKHFILLNRKEKGPFELVQRETGRIWKCKWWTSGNGISGRRKGTNEGMEKGLGVERRQHGKEDNGE